MIPRIKKSNNFMNKEITLKFLHLNKNNTN